MILIKGLIITAPSDGKVRIHIKHFDVGYWFQSLDILLELWDHHMIHINQFVPSGLNKIVSFEMLCWCNEITLNIWVFFHFFHLSASLTDDNYTFCVRKYIQTSVTDQKGIPKN